MFFNFPLFFISAPSGCLQYYTSASGQFKSFNYRTEPAADDGPNHLANLNYAICFRIENGFCGIKYSQVSSDLFSFTLSGDASTITALGIIISKISTLQPQYNKPRNSEVLDIVNKTQLPFWGFTKHITFDILNYSIWWTKRVWRTCSLY